MENVDFNFQIKIIDQQIMQKILSYSYNIILFTYNRYFTYFEAVNLAVQ